MTLKQFNALTTILLSGINFTFPKQFLIFFRLGYFLNEKHSPSQSQLNLFVPKICRLIHLKIASCFLKTYHKSSQKRELLNSV